MRNLSMITKGDRLIVTKRIASFLDEGDVVEVIDVDENGIISFAFGEDFMHKAIMSSNECEKHFEKVVNDAPSITHEHIEEIMANSEITINTVFDKCTIVSCKLPNGYVIVESAACVSPENYDEEMGVSICLEKIANKVWELEGYRLQEDLYRENGCPYGCNDYDECDCPYDCDDCDEEFDECLDTDLDCDECDDFDCPYNTNNNK